MEKELQEVSRFYAIVVDFITNYSIQIIGAIIILGLGVVASKYVYKYVLKLLLKTSLDEIICRFIANLMRFLVIAMMVILALGKLGISIGPFVAAMGAVSLTAGLALQGSVANFAAGVVLIATKPFKVGDTITVHGTYGEVKEVKLAYTVMINEDKEQITIPNKYMIGDVLVNSFAYRLVEGSIGVALESDIEKTLKAIKDALSSVTEVSNENEPMIGIESFGDFSIKIGYRYWVPTNRFFKTQYAVNFKILEFLKEANITIAFPQCEVRVLK